MGSSPLVSTSKKALLSKDKRAFLNDVFRCAERDVHFVRDVRLRRVMCLRAWVEHITSLLPKAKTSLRAWRATSLARQGKHHFIETATELMWDVSEVKEVICPTARSLAQKKGAKEIAKKIGNKSYRVLCAWTILDFMKANMT